MEVQIKVKIRKSVNVGWTCTPQVFWAVTAAMAVEQKTPRAAHVFMSAWIPAPAPESEPATLRTWGGGSRENRNSVVVEVVRICCCCCCCWAAQSTLRELRREAEAVDAAAAMASSAITGRKDGWMDGWMDLLATCSSGALLPWPKGKTEKTERKKEVEETGYQYIYIYLTCTQLLGSISQVHQSLSQVKSSQVKGCILIDIHICGTRIAQIR